MKTMLVFGADRIAQQALASLEPVDSTLVFVIDKSTSTKRLAKLIWRRRLSIRLVIKMLICELRRKRIDVSKFPLNAIRNNNDLLNLMDAHRPGRVILFRAGLVINKEIISRGIPLLNIHCANVPKYGGLGSIERALCDNAIHQNATLHQVTTAIDKGDIFDVEPYDLDKGKPYCYNENIAYFAGIRLLLRSVKSNIGARS